MWLGRLLLIAMPCMLGAGCNLIENATRTVLCEPHYFRDRRDRHLSCIAEHQMAETAWKKLTAAHPDPAYSRDYECGFIDGFADYLHVGGTGEPPPVPPRKYWNLRYRSARGRQAIDDWFAGFRHGSEAAKQSGLRQLIVVPASVAIPDALSEPYSAGNLGRRQHDAPANQSPANQSPANELRFVPQPPSERLPPPLPGLDTPLPGPDAPPAHETPLPGQAAAPQLLPAPVPQWPAPTLPVAAGEATQLSLLERPAADAMPVADQTQAPLVRSASPRRPLLHLLQPP